MGYRAPKRRQVALEFEGDLAGLTVLMKSPSEKTMRAVLRLADLSTEDDLTEEDQGIVRSLLFCFHDELLEWNLEDPESGEPVSTTQEGIESQDGEFIMQIVAAWAATLRRKPKVPRVKQVPVGEPRPDFEAALPMSVIE